MNGCINYIKNIRVNKIHHLEDFNIAIEDTNAPHLLITGKNGSHLMNSELESTCIARVHTPIVMKARCIK